MQHSTQQAIEKKKTSLVGLVLFVFILLSFNTEIRAQGISSGVTFNWADTQTNTSSPATIESITVDGNTYNTFVVPSSYEMTRLGPGGHNGNRIQLNGSQIMNNSANANWNSEAIKAYQSLNLNHYFESNSNGDEFCGNYSALATTNAQVQTISYNPGIPSNEDGVLAVTERNANNCLHISVYGTPIGGGAIEMLGQTFVRPNSSSSGPQPNIAPSSTSDYWLTERVNENNGTIGIALFKLSQLAPVGSIISEIRFTAATSDNGDGKFFLMQTYAVDDIFDSEFDETFNGDVGANDNVPVGSNYSYFTSVSPLNGTVVVNADGTFTYAPNPGFVGTDVFEVEVCLPVPNEAVCNTSTVTLTVKPDNLPTAIDDTYTIGEGTTNNIFNVLSNDNFGLDGPQENTALTIISNPINGTASVNNNGTPTNPLDDFIEYTPDAYYSGSDSLTYEITDANGTVATANVDITVELDTSYNLAITVQSLTVPEDIGMAVLTIGIEGTYRPGAIINYSTSNASAIAGEDYSSVSETYTLATENITSFDILIPITDDNLIEPSESFLVNFAYNTPAVSATASVSVSITDNDNGADQGVSINDFTVNENVGTASFTVSLNGNVQNSFTVDYDLLNGSATEDEDYTGSSGTITFNGTDGESYVINVPIIDDSIIEATENLEGKLSNLSTTLINVVDANGLGTITDNDGGAGIGVSVSDFTVNEDAGTATFDISLNADVQGGFAVDFTVADGSAISPDDYSVANASGTLNFIGNNGEVQTVTVTILDDALIEGSEDLNITLSGLSTGLINIVDANGVGTITDNDGGPGIGVSVSDFTVNEDAGTATFDISLNADVQGGFAVDFTVADGSAISPDDYSVANASGTLNFIGNNGEVQTVTVNIIDDALIEGSEDLNITLSGLSTGLINIVDANGVGTINDNDGGAGIGVSVSDFTVNEDAGTATFDVSLNADVQGGFTVDFTVADGSAISPDDYTVTNASGTLNFIGNNGEVQTVTVTILDDALIEGTEDLNIALSNLTSTLINIVDANGVGTINDNDGGAGIGVSVSDFTVNEDAGTATFDVSLNADVQGGFAVDFTVADGSAISPDDYTVTNASGTLNFIGNNGEVQTVTVTILDDALIEGSEDLNITLSNLTSTLINIVDANGVGTINDNDGGAGIGVSVSDFTVNEDAGTATFDVSLNADVQGGFAVDFTVADGSAISPDDYTVTNASGTLNFIGNNGEVQTVTVTILDDALIEGSEDLNITLSNLTSTLINIVDANGLGTITDNDGGAGIGVSVSDFTVNEDAGTATFDVSLNADVQGGFAVDFTVADGSAISPDDYTVTNASGTLNFIGNNNEVRTVTVTILDDALIEGSEDLNITLSNLTSTLINIVDANGVGTINDNDGGAGIGVSVSDFTVNEDAGTATFDVSLNADVQGGFAVDFTVADGSAISPDDYTVSNASGTLNFIGNNGEVQTVTVNIVDDALIEGTEDLNITLSGLTSTLINIVDANGLGTITDNDGGAGIGVSVSDFTVNEDAGTATFDVSLNADVQGGFAVDFTVADGSAISPDDYTVTNASGTLNFIGNNGEVQTVTVTILDDALIEGSEDLNITLSNLTSTLINIVDANGLGTITDNDGGAGIGVSVSDFTVNEDAGTATFDVSLNADVQGGFAVDFTVADGSAISLDDYTVASASGTLNFIGNNNEVRTVTVTILDDALIEGTENLNITLSGLSTGLINIVDANGVGTINDNDGGAGTGIFFENTEVTVNEGDGTATFNVRFVGNFPTPFTVTFNSNDGTATNTQDYTGVSDILTFSGVDGQVLPITVPIIDDTVIETTEDFNINLSNASSSLIAINTAQARGSIIDNDAVSGTGISFTNNNIIVTEGIDSFARFTVTLTGNIEENVTVDYITNNGTALDGADITAQSGTITFTTSTKSFDIDVPILDDTIIEPQEAFTVVLSNIQSNIGIGFIDGNTSNTANGIINDDDNIPGTTGVGFDDDSIVVNEADGTATISVELSGNVQGGFTIDFTTNDNTAIAGQDYTANLGTLTFAGNDGEKQDIIVSITDDTFIETMEQFFIDLSNLSTTVIDIIDAQATVDIIDNDLIANTGLSFENTNVEVIEGVGVTAIFDVVLTGNFQEAFDVSFETVFGSATDTDFVAQSDVISFTGTDGEVQTIVVTILDDNIIEPTESYTVNLTGATNPLVTINTPQANGSILDDDLMATDGISFNNTNIEVIEGVGVTATFDVVLTGNFQDAFDVSFETDFGTATDMDFEAQTGNISFTGADGEVQTIVVTILDDNIIEPTESYTVNLTGTTNPLVTINTPQANGSILDDDNDPSLGIQFDVTSVDIDEAAGTVSLNVVLNANVQDEFTIEYHTEDILAMDVFDYTGIASGSQTLTFGGTNPNTQVIVIPIIDDIIIESMENFNVILSNITTALVSIIANDTAIVNIIDNDGNEGWPEDITIEACDTIPAAEEITSTTACDITVVLEEGIEGQDDECATEYTITRTWTITDCVGNVREHVQVVTIEDTVAPVFVEALPQDMTVACNEVPEAAILTALDSCEQNIEVTFEEVITNDANCAEGYTVTRTWTASDCAGNEVTHTQVVTIPPTGPIVAGPYEEEITILCGDELPEVPELTFTGGCGNYDIVFTEEVQISSESDDFMIIRTWNVTDSCDNTASFEQIIFVLQPQLAEVTIDICVEEELIDLLNYLPEGFDANGEFMVLEGDVTTNGSMFDPLDHEPGEYKIAYTALGGECKYYVDFTILVNTDCVPCGRDEIEISKTITPNGDGVNDTFEIRGVEFCQFTFDVVLFNRWGNKVAEVMDYQNTWGGEAPDGSFGSSGILPAGTYYYIINATDTETGEKLEPFNGFIYLGSK
ncbi:Calx-beta domain-containing protein [Maribacter sp. R77961]|uniref:Calx-beta domain-containing protein n=1 Tax=Maribacter sp. R77961 TaxID=3093871 RepID=UPI0037C9AD81